MSTKYLSILYILYFFWGITLDGVIAQDSVYTLEIEQTQEAIKIDGILDEQTWQQTSCTAESFMMTYPKDSVFAKSKTKTFLSYDEENLYIAAICYDKNQNKKYVVQSLKRDFSFTVNDAFAVFIDSEGGKNNGQSFSVSPHGVQRDGTIGRGGMSGVTTAWDGLWYAHTHTGDGFWSLEMAIPFKTLRYSKDQKHWRINFARNDLKRNERSTWIPVPRGINVASLGNTGILSWKQSPPFNDSRVTLIPYVANRIEQDKVGNNEVKNHPNIGLDAKVSITPSLNFDVTINPDFSQVDVDQQVINLSRFEVSFPERRVFFTENSDMFSGLGNSRVRPFFSRRIGAVDGEPVPILGGLKFSGSIDKNWRVGFLGVQTKTEDGSASDTQNYLVASGSYVTQGKKKEGTNIITGFVTNRQAFDGGFHPIQNDNNFTGGIQYEYRKKTRIRSRSYFNFATNQERHTKATTAFGAKLRYQTQKINVFGGFDAVGRNYITDMGFVPRLYHSNNDGDAVRIGYVQYRTNFEYRFYSPKKIDAKKHRIDFIAPFARFNLYTDSNLAYQEHRTKVGLKIQLLNSSVFKIEYDEDDPILFYDFQLSGLNKVFTPGNYHQNIFKISYDTGKRSLFNAMAELSYGDKFMGKQFSVNTEVGWRPSKNYIFNLSWVQKELFGFPTGFGSSSFCLIGAKTEIAFSRNMFWTNFLQYNTQDQNFNINARFQWRYKPQSDIFLVISNNYGTDPTLFSYMRDWSVALKINYWLNL